MIAKAFSFYKSAYTGLPKSVWLLSSVVFVNRMGTMVLPFLTLYLTQIRGISPEHAGLMVGLFGVGGIIGSYLSGHLCTKVAPIYIQLVTLACVSIGFLTLSTLTSPISISIMLFCIGLCTEGFRPANATAIMTTCTPNVKARGFALNRLAINAGMSIGPAMGGFVALYSYYWLFYVDAATSCIAFTVLLVFFKTLNPPRTESTPPKIPASRNNPALRDRRFLLFLCVLLPVFLVFMQFFMTLPVYFKVVYGFNEGHIGALVCINTLLIIGFEMILIQKVEPYPPLLMVALGSFFIGLGFLVLPFYISPLTAIVSIILMTIGEMLALPIAIAYCSNRGKTEDQGHYMGLYYSTLSLAVVLAPIIGMACFQRYPNLLWPLCFVACTLGSIAFIVFHRFENSK